MVFGNKIFTVFGLHLIDVSRSLTQHFHINRVRGLGVWRGQERRNRRERIAGTPVYMQGVKVQTFTTHLSECHNVLQKRKHFTNRDKISTKHNKTNNSENSC
jgi:hypothetical protein